MALIKCPECKKKVSDQVANCPHCGYPIPPVTEKEPESETPKKWNKKTLLIAGIAAAAVLLVIIGIIVFVSMRKNDTSDTTDPTSVTQTTGTNETTVPTENVVPGETETEPSEEEVGQPFDVEAHSGCYEGYAYIEVWDYDEEYISFFYAESSYDGTSVATIDELIPIADIVNNQVTFSFTDSWGNVGTVEMTFLDAEIVATITVEEYDSSALFGVSEGTDTYYYFEYEEGDYDSDDDMPEEDYTPDNTQSYGILIGGIYYDDVTYQLPVSVDQLKQDIIQKGINKFEVDKQKVSFEIAHFMPIKGGYANRYNNDEYYVYVHAYFTNGKTTYDCQLRMLYKHYDVGGWVYSSYSTVKKVKIDGTVTNPFYPSSQKTGQFSYNDYPSGMPISMGELADDILYGDLNAIVVNGKLSLFDITSIQIISGDYRTNEYGEYLDLNVRVDYNNATHSGYANLKLTYQYFVAGGWELRDNYYHENGLHHTFSSGSIKIQPKQADYSDAKFLETMGEYFTKIVQIDSTSRVNADGNMVKEITYDAVREHSYLKEYYKIVLTAEFNHSMWYETADTYLLKADYSKLIGLWEYKIDDDYIRVRIKDIKLELNGSAWKSDVSRVLITYDYETSAWHSDAYTKENVTDELEVVFEGVWYGIRSVIMHFHRAPMGVIEETAGTSNVDNYMMDICVDQDKGIRLDGILPSWLKSKDGTVFTKIG